ncbi:helix-turn-helix transcriptional regulator [Mycobacteriaceae bacterium NPDC060252]
MAQTSKANAELGAFLRSRRAELNSDLVGLPPSAGRRRVTGLRREEVALLAGISPDYYARIEQGRLPSVSEDTVEAICRALQLNPDQEAYVRTLARKPTALRTTQDAPVDPVTRNLLTHVNEIPTLALGPYLDIHGWNPLASLLFLDFAELPRERRNLVWLAFLHPQIRAMYVDWESVGRECVAFLRMDAARQPDNPRLADLIGELSASDSDFRSWWSSQDVSHHNTSGRKRYRHPAIGEFSLDWQIYHRETTVTTRLAFLVPSDTHSAAALTALSCAGLNYQTRT